MSRDALREALESDAAINAGVAALPEYWRGSAWYMGEAVKTIALAAYDAALEVVPEREERVTLKSPPDIYRPAPGQFSNAEAKPERPNPASFEVAPQRALDEQIGSADATDSESDDPYSDPLMEAIQEIIDEWEGQSLAAAACILLHLRSVGIEAVGPLAGPQATNPEGVVGEVAPEQEEGTDDGLRPTSGPPATVEIELAEFSGKRSWYWGIYDEQHVCLSWGPRKGAVRSLAKARKTVFNALCGWYRIVDFDGDEVPPLDPTAVAFGGGIVLARYKGKLERIGLEPKAEASYPEYPEEFEARARERFGEGATGMVGSEGLRTEMHPGFDQAHSLIRRSGEDTP